MPNYQNGKIYKLWSPQGLEDEIYYGSTTLGLSKRKTQHKTSSRKCSSSILFEKYDDVRIELIECFPCDNKEELNKKEGEYIRNNKCLNKVIPDRTNKEYREQNKERIKEQKKEYLQKNREHNKEKCKKYYQKNKEEITEQKKENITCECGCIIRKSDLARHKKTNKHITLLENL